MTIVQSKIEGSLLRYVSRARYIPVATISEEFVLDPISIFTQQSFIGILGDVPLDPGDVAQAEAAVQVLSPIEVFVGRRICREVVLRLIPAPDARDDAVKGRGPAAG